MDETVHVAVAVIVNSADEVCISLRHEDAHQGGLWEFPGGKVEHDETVDDALIREIKEELDIVIKHTRPLITITHVYSDKKVCLHVQKVLSFDGVAVGLEGQQVKWVSVEQLAEQDFPEANLPIIKALQLPEKYLITGNYSDVEDFSKKLDLALQSGIRLVQLRLKGNHQDQLDRQRELLVVASDLCRHANAKLLFNVPAMLLDSIDPATIIFDGLHADSQTLMSLLRRPAVNLFSASCHNYDQLLKAEKLDADFIVLSPVQKTSSHPELNPIGWHQFAQMTASATMPVYALGGVSAGDLEKAWVHGGQGIAAISAFWSNS